MSVVPTLAPSMMASAGTRATSPLAVKEVAMRAAAVLLWRMAVTSTPESMALTRLRSAVESRRRRSEPKARTMPLCTMCRPQSSNAMPPITSRRIMLPIGTSRPVGVRRRRWPSDAARRICARASCRCQLRGEAGARSAAITRSSGSKRAALLARSALPSLSPSPARKSLTVPPASVTRRMPASASHGWRWRP